MKTSFARRVEPLVLSLALAAAFTAAAPASAATTVSVSAPTFLSGLAPGAYGNGFAGLSTTPPTSFSGNGFAYTITGPDGSYSNGDFLGANESGETLTIAFTGNPVTAVGGNFYATDQYDAFTSAPITLTLTFGDATTLTFTPASVSDSYRGFTSSSGITSLSLTSTSQAAFVGLDNLTVGVAAVPEPETDALMAAGLGVIAWVARRRTR